MKIAEWPSWKCVFPFYTTSLSWEVTGDQISGATDGRRFGNWMRCLRKMGEDEQLNHMQPQRTPLEKSCYLNQLVYTQSWSGHKFYF